jgi:hypothetical protein
MYGGYIVTAAGTQCLCRHCTRFCGAKMAVLTSSDAGVQAILKDTQVRQWIDLKHPDVAPSIAYIGTKVPALTAKLQSAIFNTPVAETENLALRKLYFS